MAADNSLDANRAIAREGIALILTKGVQEADEFLVKHRGKSAQIDGSLAIVRVVRCLLTWDEDAIDETDDFVKQIEKKCDNSLDTSSVEALQKSLIVRVIGADCSLLRALLSFVRMSLAYYVKGGVMLRSANKAYQKVHEEVAKHAKSNPSAFEDVRAAYSLGYGIVNLALSLLPESVLNVMKLIGFAGDRDVGRHALELVCRSPDMKAPFALLALLTYHVIIRPVLGVDAGHDFSDPIQRGDELLAFAAEKYPDAPLLDFFKGRGSYLKHDTRGAIAAFEKASSHCDGQPEVRDLCSYEIGFLHILDLEWEKSAPLFGRLLEESPWSPGLYAFLAGISMASSGRTSEAQEIFGRIPKLVKRSNSPFEKLVLRKSGVFVKTPITTSIARVVILEMAFVWNYMQWCTEAQHQRIIDLLQDERKSVEKSVYPLSASLLVEGACLLLIDQLDKAEVCLRGVLDNAETLVSQGESQVPALATFEIGLLYKQRGQMEKAKNAFSKSKSLYQGYEMESQVHTRVKGAIEALPRS